jgi:cytoskeletal protein CcmA (bactofilin family)
VDSENKASDDTQAEQAAAATPEAASDDSGKSVSQQTASAFNKPSELDAPLPEGADKPLANTSDIADLPKTGAGGQKSNFKISDITHNIYVIVFLILFVAGAGLTVYSMMGGKKKVPLATIGDTALSQTSLNELAASSASLGQAAETLTIQSNAVFSGQVLDKGNLTVAGTLQTGGAIQAPSIVASNSANLGDTQTKTLLDSGTLAVEGTSTLSNDLTVDGNSTFNGPITASQITVAKLILSNGGSLTIPNHIAFTGPPPARSSVNSSVLGGGGTATVSGSDTSGTVNVNTGNGPTPGCFVQITFNQAFTGTPRIVMTPVTSGAGQLEYYVTINSTGFSVCSANTPAGGSVDTFDYFVMGNS